MQAAFEVCRIVSLVVFLGYGGLCLHRSAMVSEFERFGLGHLRVLTGWLEILGALGLLVSYRAPLLLPFAAGGLCLLMAFAIAARVRVGDTLLQMSPAFILMMANGFLALRVSGAPLHP